MARKLAVGAASSVLSSLILLLGATAVAESSEEASASNGPVDAAQEAFGAIWKFGLFSVDDQPITVGTIVSALLLFVIGFWLSRRLSRLLGKLLMRQLKLERGVAASFEGLSYYVLLAIFVVWALNIAQVPLTAFTVMGGALAIGVGFGSQNVINNFISGLILMLERPIKEGDIIDLEGTYGRVQHIGARSTQIVTFDNIQIIVPNSSLLEKNVVNWTHSDDVVRTHVEVGVVYGSPTREVDRLIRHAMKEHGRILDKPAPIVLFTEFGDSALVFRAYFWLRVPDMMERRRVESDLRFLIDNLFREAGIEIAFPQRDVHLDFTSPLPIKVMTDDGDAEAPIQEPQ